MGSQRVSSVSCFGIYFLFEKLYRRCLVVGTIYSHLRLPSTPPPPPQKRVKQPEPTSYHCNTYQRSWFIPALDKNIWLFYYLYQAERSYSCILCWNCYFFSDLTKRWLSLKMAQDSSVRFVKAIAGYPRGLQNQISEWIRHGLALDSLRGEMTRRGDYRAFVIY